MTVAEVPLQGSLGSPRRREWLHFVVRFARRKPLGFLGGIVIVALIFVAIFGGTLAPYRYDDIDIPARLQGPSSDHWLGTDNQGRDVFSRILFGARTSIVVGFGVVLVSTVISTAIGVVSGFYRGQVDLWLQRFIDLWLAFPGLIFIIFVVSVVGTGWEVLILTLGLLWAARYSRIVRGSAISVSQNTYVEAARALGASNPRIVVTHVLPNVVPIVIVNSSLQIGAAILAESSLAFLGFGTPPPFPSWGQMLSNAQADAVRHSYLALFPGAAIALAVYAFNIFGDALRDLLDPRQRGLG